MSSSNQERSEVQSGRDGTAMNDLHRILENQLLIMEALVELLNPIAARRGCAYFRLERAIKSARSESTMGNVGRIKSA